MKKEDLVYLDHITEIEIVIEQNDQI